MALNTNRLILRDFEEEDWKEVYEYLRDEEVCKFMVFEPSNIEESKEYIKKFIKIKREEERSCYKFAVVARESGKIIGECGIISPDIKKGVGELVYRFNKDYWGRGYATEAVIEILRFGFIELKLHRIEAYCDERNRSSSKVLEKSGLRYEGCLREHKFIKGQWRSSQVYSRLDRE